MPTFRIKLPEDFEERYENYTAELMLSDNKDPKPPLEKLLSADNALLRDTNDFSDYEYVVEKWTPLKTIVDKIYSKLSPLVDDEAQRVTIDIFDLGISENQGRAIFEILINERECRLPVLFDVPNISSPNFLQYVKDSGIIVQDYRNFRKFKKWIDSYFGFLDSIKAKKFSNSTLKIKAVLGTAKAPEAEKKLIDYNPTTGKGEIIDGEKFRFKDNTAEFRIFNMLHSRIGKKVKRQDVLVAGGFYKDYEDPDPARKTAETSYINDRVKNIRSKTGLRVDDLVNNNGNLTLIARKYDKHTPNSPQTLPK